MWPEPKTFLAVSKDGAPIETVPLESQVYTGIGYRAYGKDVVTPFEEHLVRRSLRFTIEEWDKIPILHKALEVALSRAQRMIKGHEEEAISRHMKRKGR